MAWCNGLGVMGGCGGGCGGWGWWGGVEVGVVVDVIAVCNG